MEVGANRRRSSDGYQRSSRSYERTVDGTQSGRMAANRSGSDSSVVCFHGQPVERIQGEMVLNTAASA
jgi:hypothetical protein